MIKGQWMILFFKILLTIIIVVIFTCSIILFRNYVVKINYNKIENYIKNKRYFINLNNYLNSIGIYKKYLQYLIIILSLIFSIIIANSSPPSLYALAFCGNASSNFKDIAFKSSSPIS